MKPVRLFKKVAAAFAAGLLALGLVAGTAAAASANSSDIGSYDSSVSASEPAEFTALGGNSGDIG